MKPLYEIARNKARLSDLVDDVRWDSKLQPIHRYDNLYNFNKSVDDGTSIISWVGKISEIAQTKFHYPFFRGARLANNYNMTVNRLSSMDTRRIKCLARKSQET